MNGNQEKERRKSGKMTGRRMIASHAPLKTTNHYPQRAVKDHALRRAVEMNGKGQKSVN